MKKIMILILSFTALLLVAGSADLNESYTIEKMWEVTGLSQPESVLSIPNHKWIYVSNTNGLETGFISQLSKDGKIEHLKWTDGIGNPTGMGSYDGKLYVVDNTQVQVINLETAKIIKTLPSDGKMLNDLTIGNDGQIFVSDLVTGNIFTVENDKLVPWLHSDQFSVPNGVLVQGENLILGTVGTELSQNLTPDKFGSVYKIKLADRSVKLIPVTEKLGTIDGVVNFQNGIIVSSPFTGELIYIANGKTVLLLDKIEGGIADIWMDSETNTIFAPFLFGNKVTAYKVVTEKWTRLTTKAEFLDKIADRYFGDEGGSSVATSDGKITGNFGGKELKGTWNWNGEYLSRTSTIGDIDLGHDDIVIEVSGNKMRLILEKGSGMSVVYEQQ